MIKKIEYDLNVVGSSSSAMIAIHGWRGNRSSMKPIMQSINIPNMDWYFLEAPYVFNSLENEYTWSYKNSLGLWEVDEPKKILNKFFQELMSKYKSENIYAMGFSQGAMVCLEFVLHIEKPLGGIFVLSGFLRKPKLNILRYHMSQEKTPILISHGKNDDIIPVETSYQIYNNLKKQGANVELLTYNGNHKIGIECIRRIKKIIQK